MEWEGTFLNGTFLAPARFWRELPGLMSQWQRSGLLAQGKGEWLQLPPEKAGYDQVMEGHPVKEMTWTQTQGDLGDLARSHTLLRLVFPFAWEHGPGELLLEPMVQPDNSVELLLSAPYSSLYEEQAPAVGLANIERFAEVACQLFVSSLFLTGELNEEVHLGGLQALLAEERLPADWAFYGAPLAGILRNHLDARATVRDLPGGGIFVRWTTWDQPAQSPEAWQQALVQAARQVRVEP